jgi:hypothetical protein
MSPDLDLYFFDKLRLYPSLYLKVQARVEPWFITGVVNQNIMKKLKLMDMKYHWL